jgi:hypothetical protein
MRGLHLDLGAQHNPRVVYGSPLGRPGSQPASTPGEHTAWAPARDRASRHRERGLRARAGRDLPSTLGVPTDEASSSTSVSLGCSVGPRRRGAGRRPSMSEVHPPAEAIGTVIHWFDHLSVAAVRLTAPLAVVSGATSGPIQPTRWRQSYPLPPSRR